MRQDLAMPKGPLRELAKAWLAKYPEFRDHGQKRLRAFIETGFPDWYEWSIHHWGSKWNAYHVRIATTEPLEFYFDTAWNFPLPVFAAIAARFPKLAFRCTCFDEGWNFAGDGFFNPPSGQCGFSVCDATPELYEHVYGESWQPES
jgi:hypothetical protein